MGRFTRYYGYYEIKCDESSHCGCELCCGEAYIDKDGKVVYLLPLEVDVYTLNTEEE